MTRATALLFCAVLAVHVPARADSLLRSSVSVEWALDVAVDAEGFVYTLSTVTDTIGWRDIEVRRYAPGSSSLTNVFTFGGSRHEDGVAIAIAGDTVYVTGQTHSYDLPIHNAMQPYSGGDVDVFVAAFRLDGTIRYATYFGGYGSDAVRAMAVTPGGQVHLVGHVYNQSGDDRLAGLPTTAPPLDNSNPYGAGWVASLSATGAELVYSSRLDEAASIAADAAGGAYVVASQFGTGMTVTKLTAGGHRIYRTIVGQAHSRAVTADVNGNVYIAGWNLADDFATQTGPQPYPSGLASATLTKLNPAGVRVFTTHIGGNDPQDDVRAVDLETDDSGHVYFLGTGSGVATLHQIAPPAAGNTFVVKVRSDGSIIYSTPLGSGGGQAYALATFGDTVTVLASSNPGPSIPDERFRGTFLATLGDPAGTDVSVVTSVSTSQPEAGKPLSYVGTVLVGGEAVDWTTLTVALPGDAAGLGCTAAGAISCAQRGNTWVATYARLPAYAQRRVVVAARGTCMTGGAPSVTVSFDLATSAYEEPEHRNNNHRDVRMAVANAAPIVTLQPSTYRLPSALDGWIAVGLIYDATDDCAPPVCTLEIGSSDATATSGDWEVVGDREVRLRSGPALAGRVYEIGRRCVDEAGHATIATAWVQVEPAEPPPTVQTITAGAVYMYTDPDDSMHLSLRGDRFSIEGQHGGGFGYPCSTCGDARFSQRVTFDGGGWFSATIGDRYYDDIRLAGAVQLDTGLVALDEYYPSIYHAEPEIRGDGHFFVSGRLSGFTRAGSKIFDVTITGGGQLRLDLWGQDTLVLAFDENAVAPVVAQRLRVLSPAARPVTLRRGSTQHMEWTYEGPATAFLIVAQDWWSEAILATVPRRPGRTQFADVAIDRQYFDAALLVIAVDDTAAFDTTAPILLTP